MTRYLLTSAAMAAALIATNAARAADPTPVVVSPALISPPQAPAAQDWTGPYIGIHGGYGKPYFTGFWDNPEWSEGCGCFFNDGGAVDFLAKPGVLGGIHAGYNFQRGSVVFGIEVDATAARLGMAGSFINLNDGTPQSSGNAFFAVDLLASVRARLGMAFGDFHAYGTVGVGYVGAEFGANTSDSHPLDTAVVSLSGFGLAFGGGMEWRATERVSLRGEFLRYRLNEVRDVRGLGDGDSAPENFVTFRGVSTLRLGMSFHF
jgi:outer membrane immunogenic protein